MHISFIRIIMHHTLHKTNNILSKFLLFSPKQVKVASDANRSRINTRIQTGKLSERPTLLSSDNRSMINTRSQTGNLSRTITSYPPITGSGSTPDAQQGNIHISPTIIPSEQSARRTILTPSYYQQQLRESGVRLGCLGWHLKPTSDYLSTFLSFQNAAYLIKNQYQPTTSFKMNTKSSVRLSPDGILRPSPFPSRSIYRA